MIKLPISDSLNISYTVDSISIHLALITSIYQTPFSDRDTASIISNFKDTESESLKI